MLRVVSGSDRGTEHEKHSRNYDADAHAKPSRWVVRKIWRPSRLSHLTALPRFTASAHLLTAKPSLNARIFRSWC